MDSKFGGNGMSRDAIVLSLIHFFSHDLKILAIATEPYDRLSYLQIQSSLNWLFLDYLHTTVSILI